LWDSGHIGLGPFRVWNNMQREEMGIVNGNGNKHGRGMGMALWEWESERHSRTPLLSCQFVSSLDSRLVA